MTVSGYAKQNNVSNVAVYSKIKRGLLPYSIDEDGCVDIKKDEPWKRGRPGKRIKNGVQ